MACAAVFGGVRAVFSGASSLARLGKQGFETVDIGKKTFVHKTYKVGDEEVSFAASFAKKGRSAQLDDVQIFTSKGSGEKSLGTRGVLDLKKQITNDLKKAGFKKVEATGVRISGANKGKTVTVKRDIE